jgi:hypothetical protein
MLVGIVSQQPHRFPKVREPRLGEDRLVRDLATDAMGKEPVHLLSIRGAVVALKLVPRRPERTIQGDVDASLFAHLAAGGSLRRLISL